MKISEVLKTLSASNAAIKNTASLVEKEGWYPAYSASGQDVWLPDYRFDQKGIVVSAVGARCGKAFKADGKWNVCANTHVLAVDETIADRDYCWYMINNEDWWIKGGTAQPFVKVKDSLNREHIFPSLSEQKRIVSELNYISTIISLRNQELKTLDELVKARFVEMFGDPEWNNKGWISTKLEKICSVGSSKRIYQSEQTNEGVPFLRIADLVNLMDTDILKSDLYISCSTYCDLKNRGLVPVEKDILVTSRGTLGRCYIIKEGDEFYFQDGMISWLSNFNQNISPVFLSYLFAMNGIQKQIDKMQAGSTVAYLSIAMLKKLDIIIPPFELQKQFAAFVQQIDKSKLTVQQSLDKLEVLKKKLMQEYFG